MLGVLMMNTGTPDAPTPDAVKPYLRQFLSDRNLIDMPPALWQPILNLFILPNRPRRTAPLYRAIWTPEGSPFMKDSLAQRDALERSLGELALEPVKVEIGMRYGNPSIASGLAALRDAGADTVVALPLYPQRTQSCAGTCFQEFNHAFAQVFGEPPAQDVAESGFSHQANASRYEGASSHTDAASVDGPLCANEISEFVGSARVPRVVRIAHYWDAPGYMKTLSDSVRRSWDYAPGSKLVVSFHSIPMSHAQAGDPYPEQTLATARSLADSLGIPRGDVRLAYQSRFDGRTWIGPMLEPVLSRLAKEQVKNVAVICPGFSADCLETLHEVKDLAARHFEEECVRFGNDGARFAYVPALGSDSALIETLAHLVASRVAG